MRTASVLGTALYLIGLAVGSLSLGSGCGGSKQEEFVPTVQKDPSPEEVKGRMEAMKKAEAGRRSAR